MNKLGFFLKLQVFTILVSTATSAAVSAESKPRIAVFAGPTATVLNSPPLVTSQKARDKKRLSNSGETRDSPGLDHLVPQRLAAPVEVFIEQFSAHPLEMDSAHLYAPPDGYIGSDGSFHATRRSSNDTPVYRVKLSPEDGLFLLPYMALQADGSPWDGSCPLPGSPPDQCRQTFYPDASRIFEEIDRSIAGRSGRGTGSMLSSRAEFDFFRAAPSGGFSRGLPEEQRTDTGIGDIPPEVFGSDFFPYGRGIWEPSIDDLGRITNQVQEALWNGDYEGAIWLEGSPTVSDTLYWLNLVVDTPVPICGVAAQRVHGMLSNDGNRNIVDAVDYIISRVWADAEGRDSHGGVMIQDEQIFYSRQVEKEDARPGGYRAAGSHGGVLGTIGDPGPVTVWFRPTTLHTWKSLTRLSLLPRQVPGVRRVGERLESVLVETKSESRLLVPEAVPRVTNVRQNRWIMNQIPPQVEEEVEVLARVDRNLKDRPLAGFVVEGLTPYGAVHESLGQALDIAALSGMPVVVVSRGDAGGMVPVNPHNLWIEGNNLTPGKARMLLIAALLKLGGLPPASDPRQATPQEREAVQEKIRQFQELFNTH